MPFWQRNLDSYYQLNILCAVIATVIEDAFDGEGVFGDDQTPPFDGMVQFVNKFQREELLSSLRSYY